MEVFFFQISRCSVAHSQLSSLTSHSLTHSLQRRRRPRRGLPRVHQPVPGHGRGRRHVLPRRARRASLGGEAAVPRGAAALRREVCFEFEFFCCCCSFYKFFFCPPPPPAGHARFLTRLSLLEGQGQAPRPALLVSSGSEVRRACGAIPCDLLQVHHRLVPALAPRRAGRRGRRGAGRWVPRWRRGRESGRSGGDGREGSGAWRRRKSCCSWRDSFFFFSFFLLHSFFFFLNGLLPGGPPLPAAARGLGPRRGGLPLRRAPLLAQPLRPHHPQILPQLPRRVRLPLRFPPLFRERAGGLCPRRPGQDGPGQGRRRGDEDRAFGKGNEAGRRGRGGRGFVGRHLRFHRSGRKRKGFGANNRRVRHRPGPGHRRGERRRRQGPGSSQACPGRRPGRSFFDHAQGHRRPESPEEPARRHQAHLRLRVAAASLLPHQGLVAGGEGLGGDLRGLRSGGEDDGRHAVPVVAGQLPERGHHGRDGRAAAAVLCCPGLQLREREKGERGGGGRSGGGKKKKRRKKFFFSRSFLNKQRKTHFFLSFLSLFLSQTHFNKPPISRHPATSQGSATGPRPCAPTTASPRRSSPRSWR